VKDLPCEGPGQVGLGDRPRLAGPPRAPPGMPTASAWPSA